jgi:hypothetical protein
MLKWKKEYSRGVFRHERRFFLQVIFSAMFRRICGAFQVQAGGRDRIVSQRAAFFPESSSPDRLFCTQ